MKIEVFCFSSLTLSAVQDAELPVKRRLQRLPKAKQNTANVEKTNYKQITVKSTEAKKIYVVLPEFLHSKDVKAFICV